MILINIEKKEKIPIHYELNDIFLYMHIMKQMWASSPFWLFHVFYFLIKENVINDKWCIICFFLSSMLIYI
jgi:hypothetical protein